MNIEFSAFKKYRSINNVLNNQSTVTVVFDADKTLFDGFCAELSEKGFANME